MCDCLQLFLHFQHVLALPVSPIEPWIWTENTLRVEKCYILTVGCEFSATFRFRHNQQLLSWLFISLDWIQLHWDYTTLSTSQQNAVCM